MRVDRAFLAFLGEADARAAPRSSSPRAANPPAGQRRVRAAGRARAARRGLHRQAVRHRARGARARRAPPRARAALFGEAPVRPAPRDAQGRSRPSSTASIRAAREASRSIHRARVRAQGHRMAAGRSRRMRASSSSRRATPRGPRTRRRARRSTAAACCSRRRASSTSCASCRSHTETRAAASPSTSSTHLRRREGFALTDPGTDLVGALDQAHYCIWCHEQGKDSCSKGLQEKAAGATELSVQEDRVRRAARRLPAGGEDLRVPQAARREGWPLGALGDHRVDNPMVAATGHRICNDCMKSCIYQKQEPVDIPQAETRTLKDVLALPWGFEIYSLLTRWNPLNLRRPYAAGRRPASACWSSAWARRASRSRITC